MKHVSDDGQVEGTIEQVEHYEAEKRRMDELQAEVQEYLDAISIKNKQGKHEPLSQRERSRRMSVIMGWLTWDRTLNKARYEKSEEEQEEYDQAAVAAITGAA